MSFFEDAVIQDSVEIKAQPEDVFNFLTGIVDDNTYKAWHKDDHVCFKCSTFGNGLRRQK